MNTKQALLPIIVVLVVIVSVAFFLFNPVPPLSGDTVPQQEITTASHDGFMLDVTTDPTLSPAVTGAQLALAGRLATNDIQTISIESEESVEWSNGCLDLAAPNELCTQVITPGHRVVLGVGDKKYSYRTNADGTLIRFETEW
jgi:hypothetical protein